MIIIGAIVPHDHLGALHPQEATVRRLLVANPAYNQRPVHQHPAGDR